MPKSLAMPLARGREEWLWLAPFATLCIGTFSAAAILGMGFEASTFAMLGDYGYKALKALPNMILLAISLQLVIALREKREEPIREILNGIRAFGRETALLAPRLMPLLLMPLMFTGFSMLKMLLPRFVPFYLDDAFAAADRILFLGRQPWELTHAVLGSITATMVMDRLYSAWVLMLSIAIVGMALFAPRKERARFFLAFALAWVLLGVMGAWATSTAGPCFSALIGAQSAPEFEGLMTRLMGMWRETGGAINAPGWQQVLWQAYATETYAPGMGISAMPSLHNAIAVLYALLAFRFSRIAGIFFSIYAVLIFIGSVHLGWHYAVDGIVSVIAMWLIWRGVNWWCRASGYDAAAERADEASSGGGDRAAAKPLTA